MIIRIVKYNLQEGEEKKMQPHGNLHIKDKSIERHRGNGQH